jgi:hypothetical protein
LWSAYREKKVAFVNQREKDEELKQTQRDAKRVKESLVEVPEEERNAVTGIDYNTMFERGEWFRKGKKIMKKVRVIG